MPRRRRREPEAANPWLGNPEPAMRAHLEAVLRGEVRFGARRGTPEPTWADVPRRKRRLVVQCRHGRDDESAPRKEIGGLTSDRVYSLVDTGQSLGLGGPPTEMPCPVCGTTWLVPATTLQHLARQRGHQLLLQLVDQIPGVSVAP